MLSVDLDHCFCSDLVLDHVPGLDHPIHLDCWSAMMTVLVVAVVMALLIVVVVVVVIAVDRNSYDCLRTVSCLATPVSPVRLLIFMLLHKPKTKKKKVGKLQ